MTETVVGVISTSCSKCEELKNSLIRDFSKSSIDLDFIEIVYEEDPDEAMIIAEKFNLNDVPSFSIRGISFGQYYSSSQVQKAISLIKEGNNG